MHLRPPGDRKALLLMFSTIGFAVAACGSAGPTSPAPSVASASPTVTATTSPSGLPAVASPGGVPTNSPEPESGGGTTSGDVPDNAVFLTYRGGTPAFSIQYVEGWQVRSQPDGVLVRDKDSSETVAIVPSPADLAGWIASTDLPELQAQAGFKFIKQDRVKVAAILYDHLVYHLLAPPDPVTGKRVPSTVDRYYVPGPAALAIVSLSTPDGVDNVDAFRQMIESFKWQ